jgi:tRNA modification GTPase
MIRTLQREQFIRATPAQVWAFFATPANLNEMTPPRVRFQIIGTPPTHMYAGQLIAYRISPVPGLWLNWLTEIRHVREEAYFVDEQRAGPYKFWYHEHRFSAEAGGVRMTDLRCWLGSVRVAGRETVGTSPARTNFRVSLPAGGRNLQPRDLAASRFHFAFAGVFACVGPMPSSPEIIAALATPVGTSALAVLRVSGTGSADLVEKIFAETPLPRNARHADYTDHRGQLLDDVVFTYFAGPNSFTGEDSLEISCHGNPFIAQKILEDLITRGCRLAEPGEFSKRAFLNGRMDLSQAEAVMDLISARSERALAAANLQLRGALGRQMDTLITRTINVLAQIEAYIDFPDEDLPPENQSALSLELKALLTDTQRLIATHHYGDLLRDGIKTVILGEPNAGKSSLLNRLVGRERALVSDEPGTTRDYLEERLLIGGHSLRLIDTAGFNVDASPLEKRGIELALDQAASADLYLWVIDSTGPLPVTPATVRSRMTPANTIVVFNKIDLPGSLPPTLPAVFPTVNLSALLGTGLEELQSAITKFAEMSRIDTGTEMIAINARHTSALESARDGLEGAILKVGDKTPSELIASDIRMVLSAFGQISGKVDNERMLDQLFSKFCIGK